ncbi:MAG TPA: pyridoxal phosphate-dependent aminotransferase [Candidatus Acidoferrum sp.]
MFSDRTGWNLEHTKLSQALAANRATGKALIDLTKSNPTECGFRYDAEAILAALNNPASLAYEPLAQGLPLARAAIAAYHRSHDCDVSIDDIFLTTSTSEAYSFLLRLLCNPGDEVLIPQPGYPLLNFLADLQDVKLVHYPLLYDHGWQIDFHALQQALTSRTRAIIVVNPNNPTGHFCKPSEIAEMSEICRKRDISILADEVFLDFALDNDKPQSFAANERALTFTISGLSKISGLPQMKVAWFVAGGPEHLKKSATARLEMIADTFLSMNAPVQLAIDTLLDQRHSFHEQCLQRVRKNLAQLDEQLSRQKLCSRLQIEGGWYATLQIPRTISEDDLAFDLLQANGAYVHPGHFYDFPADGYLVVSLITPEAEFAAGLAAVFGMLAEKFRLLKKDS